MAWVFLSVCGGGIRAESPKVTGVATSGYAVAKTVTVSFSGEHLGGVAELWSSFPAHALRESGGSLGETGGIAFRLFLPPDLPRGIGAVRISTTNGVSDWQLVLLDELPVVREEGSNQTRDKAQELSLPAAVEGVGQELGYDFYKVKGVKGQRLSVDVIAYRLGSPFDPVVRLLDSAGRELIYCDDAPGAGADARFHYQFVESGDYYIELRDTRYQGGSRYRYRLCAGDFALQPLAFLPAGRERKGNAELPGQWESEPNDTSGSATAVRIPSLIQGGFAKLRDRDHFQFEVAPNQRLVFASKTRSLGYACDLFMQIVKGDGTVVAEANVTGASDAALTNTFGEGGTYWLRVEELTERGGPDLKYQVEIRPEEPGFVLATEIDKLEVAPGGETLAKVTCARRNYEGVIELRAVGLPEGFALSNHEIPAKTNEVQVKLTAPEGIGPGRMFQFRLIGQGKVGERLIEAEISTMAALKRTFPTMLYPPQELDGFIALGIKAGKKEETPKPSEQAGTGE